jgi:cytochrome c-type biogenesis protein CcmF
VGTIWPLVAEMAFDRKLSVGAPFFNAAFSPFMVTLAAILPLGALLPWKRARLGRAMQPLWGVLALSLASGALVWAMQTGRSALGPVGVILGLWVVGGALVEIWSRAGRDVVAVRLRRLRRLPRGDWGKAAAHSGFGITIFAVAALLAWESEDIRVARVGDSFEVSGFGIELREVREVQGPNYRSTMAEMVVSRNGRQIAVVYPEKRFYQVARMPTTEAGIRNGFFEDVYLVIGDPQDDGGWAVRTFIKPFANWIWGGSIIMALGGLLSLSDRRFRIAAGAGRAPASAVAAE